MVYKVRILPTALEDARDCYHYIAGDSPDNAVTWFDGLFEAIDSLASMPGRCPVAPESAILGVEVRVLLYRKYYRILYRIEEDRVRIYHIRHTAREYLAKEEFFVPPEIDDD